MTHTAVVTSHVVDARKKQMIWEGLAEGRIIEQDMETPQQAVADVVAQLFERFPGRASAVEGAHTSD
jgi:hypothetical protein